MPALDLIISEIIIVSIMFTTTPYQTKILVGNSFPHSKLYNFTTIVKINPKYVAKDTTGKLVLSFSFSYFIFPLMHQVTERSSN